MGKYRLCNGLKLVTIEKKIQCHFMTKKKLIFVAPESHKKSLESDPEWDKCMANNLSIFILLQLKQWVEQIIAFWI